MVKTIIRATDTVKELLLLYGVIITISSLAFALFEHKGIINSFWWSSVTAMTVGYGDLYPITLAGKIIAVLLMHIVPLFIIPLFIARILNNLVQDRNQFSNEEQEEIKQSLREIKEKLK